MAELCVAIMLYIAKLNKKIYIYIYIMSNIKNASIIDVTGRNYDRVLMVRDKKNKKWMFPGEIFFLNLTI